MGVLRALILSGSGRTVTQILSKFVQGRKNRRKKTVFGTQWRCARTNTILRNSTAAIV